MRKLKQFTIPAFIVIILNLALITSTVYSKPLKVGIYEFPPIIKADDKYNPVGLIPDILEKVLKEAKFESELKLYPVKRAIAMVLFGRIDVSVAARGQVPGPVKLALYSSESSIYKVKTGMYSTNGRSVDSLDNLIGKRVLINSGYDYGKEINKFMDDPKNKIIRDESPSHMSAVKKLLYGRGDYYLGYQMPVETLIKETPELAKKAKEVGLKHKTLETLDVIIVFSKLTSDSKNKLSQIDKAIERLKARGELK